MLAQDLSIVLPELILAGFAMAALMFGVYMGKDKQAEVILLATVAVLGVVAIMVATQEPGTRVAFEGAFINDGFARFAKVTLLLGAAVMLLLSREYLRRTDMMKFEFPVLIALAVVGMMMMVSAGDLMALYMGLELQSLSLYVVASFRRDSLRSTEAGLKYFVLGALSSGLLLYGASLVYGYTGTTDFEGIAAVIADEGMGLGLLFGLVFLTTGLAFKISAAPFHMWTPDVYEGSPTPVTAFFATAPKVAAAGLFARVMIDGFGNATADWQQILTFLAILSMFIGSIAAIGQTNIKRLMAYSSIGHMGFALVGLAAGTEEGVGALLLYMAVYVVMNIGTFAFILNMERDGRPVTDIYALGGYSVVAPAKAMAVAILMFSLAGIPPLVGFFAKYYVFTAAVAAGLVPLAVLGVVASVIGAYYYLRIIYLMYFGEEVDPLTGSMPVTHGVALAFAALVMVLAWLPGINLFGVDVIALDAAATLFN
ncbi:NADH-quinone oxidoreductase subunit NuoN [Pontivivens insulae]|uniref:NADH-quinone oxidoreductase subunit N n=1 Tax=Pontivivens insulae TaxID=1639689 RepID=A0A2R8ACQ0_9RHOB|nr:NADH-quinone oxidoreductase subunit NuoN [Pontivivens insulae]RED13781.1 NADH dehydrogenase subunit N [Pontivivens insulae]SPF29855.1 NADH-quinone oxidoreductase subunit N [Pontivivens insulae]